MAKIILNVSTNISQAKKEISTLTTVVDNLGKSFNNIKANKDFTSQIQALTKWNKSLADAVTKVVKANDQQAKSELQLERYRSQTIIRAKQQLAEGEERIARQRTKNAQETAKLHIQEERLAREQQRTAQATREATDETERQATRTRSLLDTLMQFSVTSRLLYSGLRLIRNAIRDVNETLAETEQRIIAIQRVLPDGSVSNQNLANRLYDLAIEYGQSFANVSDIATNFARTGLSYADTIESTRAALLALNVAELDSSQATEGLIAVMAQFELQATDLNDVIDKLNKTADRYPVTTEKLLSALQRMGSSASLAGLSLDETIGIATTLSKATGRSGANIGTAANALIQYSTKEKALNTYAALSPEVAAVVEKYKIGAANVLDIWKALSKEINNLTYEQSEKLDVLAEYFETGEGAGLKEELEGELGDIFNDISGVFSTANTFRKNYFVALLQNMDTVEEAAETARTSQGYSIAENEKAMDTYEKRAAALAAHWHKLANDEQGLLKFRKDLVEIADLLLTVLENTGGLRTAVTLLGTAFGVLRGNAPLAILGGIATIISTIAGAIEATAKKTREANQAALDAYYLHKDEAEQLETLYKKYLDYNTTAEEHKKIEEEIIGLLGEKAGALDGLTEGTYDYAEAVNALTQAQLRQYTLELATAANASRELLHDLPIVDFGSGDNALGFDLGALTGMGAVMKAQAEGYYGEYLTVEMYRRYQDAFNKMQENYIKLLREGKYEQADRILNSDAYKNIGAWLTENKGGIDKFVNTNAAKFLNEWLYSDEGANGIKSNADWNNAYDYIVTAFRRGGLISEDMLTGVKDLLNLYREKNELEKESLDTHERQTDKLGDIKGDYADIVDEIDSLLSKNQKVNEELEKQKALEDAIAKAKADYIRSEFDAYLSGLEVENSISEKQQSIEEARAKVEEARLNVEEKRQAVKEAEYNLQKAQDDLEYARNNRSERVFNAATGMWEYQANKKNVEAAQEKVRQATEKVEDAVKTVDSSIKDVEKAEQNVQKAVDSLTDYLKKQAIAEIKDAIADGIDNGKVAEILKKWFGEDGGGAWGTGIQNALSTAIAGASTAAATNAAVISAQQALNTYLQDEFYGAVSSLFKNGSVNVSDVNAVIDEYRKRGVSEDAVNSIKGVVSKYMGYDPWQLSGQISSLASGIGGMFGSGGLSGLGILSGALTAPGGMSYTNHGGSVDNHTYYVVNGIPIPAELAERSSLADIFNNFDLVH